MSHHFMSCHLIQKSFQMSSYHFSQKFRQTCCVPYTNKYINRTNSSYAPEKVFSEHNAKKATAKFSGMKPFRFQIHQPVKKAAFFIPLCVIEKKVCLLYTLRTNYARKFGGQVSINPF